jgi:hypothetical protein
MIGERIFAARRPPYGRSARFSRLDRNTFQASWLTSLGGSVLETTSNTAGELICLLESGDVFRVRDSQLADDPFLLQRNAQIEFDELLETPPKTSRLSDGRLSVLANGKTPKLILIRTSGQVQSELDLPEPAVAPAIDLAEGIVVPHAGRLAFYAASTAGIEDFLLPVEDGKSVSWHALLRLDETSLLTSDVTGHLRRLQYREQPVKHLAEVGELSLEAPLSFAPVLTAAGDVLAVPSDGRLLRLDAQTLSARDEIKLSPAPRHALWSVGENAFVQLGEESFVCFALGENMTEAWRVPLEGKTVAGAPFARDDYWIVPLREGELVFLSQSEGKVLGRHQVNGMPVGGVVQAGQKLLVPTVDGSLLVVPDGSEGGQ